jgi:60 kDa SS-A/Ro ribonucleoprotein
MLPADCCHSALHKAAEIACGNVPELPGSVIIGLDTSGSMSSPITGHRGRGATTKMRCIDVAALFAAAILRRNPDSVVIPFDTQAYHAQVDTGDTILSLSERLAMAAVSISRSVRIALTLPRNSGTLFMASASCAC